MKPFMTVLFVFVLMAPQWGASRSFAQSLTFERGFADLVKKTGNGVVNISTYARPRMQMQPGYPGIQGGPNDDLFRKFFEEFFGRQMGEGGVGPAIPGPKNPRNSPKNSGKLVPMGLGSGFVIDASEGLILTNNHVIDQAEEVKIQFVEEDDELVPAEIIGRDPELDVALLKVKTKMKLSAIALGDSDAIDVGEYVLAIGNPLGYGHTVSHGILSAKGRRNPEFRLGRYLQTDASINPGNSGGPLMNVKGEVIGINNAIDARAQGIGFAIPINMVKKILPQLKAKGSVSRGFLGVTVGELNPELMEQLKIDPKTKGVLIIDVTKGQPADQAGLKPYDIITEVNQVKVGNPQDLTTQVTAVPVGDRAQLKFLRNGKEKTLAVKVAERPVEGLAMQSKPSRQQKVPREESNPAVLEEFGFSAETIDGSNATSFGLDSADFKGDSRVIVTELSYDQPAVQSGLQRGDVILNVTKEGNHYAVKNVSDLVKYLSESKGKTIMLRVKRYGPRGDSTVLMIVLKR
jgi:serine protease Do